MVQQLKRRSSQRERGRALGSAGKLKSFHLIINFVVERPRWEAQMAQSPILFLFSRNSPMTRNRPDFRIAEHSSEFGQLSSIERCKCPGPHTYLPQGVLEAVKDFVEDIADLVALKNDLTGSASVAAVLKEES